jgi:hypothetical protein
VIAGADGLDRGRRPAPGPAPAIRLPHFQRFRLANGLRVLAVRHDNLPEVSAGGDGAPGRTYPDGGYDRAPGW